MKDLDAHHLAQIEDALHRGKAAHQRDRRRRRYIWTAGTIGFLAGTVLTTILIAATAIIRSVQCH